MKRVLVTGADGFIGSHLTEELVKQGFKVRAFVYYNSFNTWGWLDTFPKALLDEIEIFQGDIRDPNGVREAMREMEEVYHLAALIAIPFSYHSPDSYVDTNIKGTLNVLQAAKAQGPSRVLITSTSEVYGTAQYVPIDEKHPFQGQSPYSATKIGADRLAEAFYRSFNLPVTIVRPFNTYGPRQSARAVIPTIITQLLAGKKEIQLGSLTPTRDFNYVKDTVRGFIEIAKSDKTVGEEINIATQQEISVGQQFGIKTGIFALPFIHDPAVHIQQIRHRGVLRSQQGVAFIRSLSFLQQAKRPLKRLVRKRGQRACRQKGQAETSGQHAIHTTHPLP